MDLLQFMKEEYATIRAQLDGLLPSAHQSEGAPEGISDDLLTEFMVRVDLMIRVGGELVIPELVDSGKSASAAAMLAEEQVRVLARMVAGFKKNGHLVLAKRQELHRKLSTHLDQMERIVLPLVRELIPTAVREDIGEIAVDYRDDLRGAVVEPKVIRREASISA